jgi:para-nitrobenzyl esterase
MPPDHGHAAGSDARGHARRWAVLAALLLLVAVGLSWSGPPPAAAAAGPTARTSTGTLTGRTDGAVDRFEGVRYAEAPVGDLRLAPTRPARTTSAALDASRPGPACPQDLGAPSGAEDEDCLFLNVVRPAGGSARGLPVVVWWHGGGFTRGSGAGFDPRRMVVEGRVVVVTVNYRLGDLGYLSLPGLPGGGDFGLADQLESLRWVRGNAAAFGGDPANVTVAGESAGALSVCAALTSPAAAGLFDKAITASGACTVDWAAGALGRGSPRQSPFVARATADRLGVDRAAALGCTLPGAARLACLRSRPASSFLAGALPFIHPPAYGTTLLPRRPAEALADGAVAAVPVLSGVNHDESHSAIGEAQRASPYTPSEYSTILRDAFGADAGRVARAYPPARYPSPAMAWARAAGDASWSCPTRAADRVLAARTALYAYEFDDRDAPAVPAPPGFRFGAYHAADVPYLFDVGIPLSPEQQRLAAVMRAYWTNFARSGDPNGASLPPMPRSTTTAATTSLSPGPGGIGPTDFAADHRCDLWATVRF